MKLFLVRHGQSEGNVNPRLYFETPDSDIALTDKGKADAVDAADSIYSLVHYPHTQKEYPSIERECFNLYHSTYKRATQTANILYDRLNNNEGYSVDNVFPSPLCREREWGGLRDILQQRQKTEQHFNFYYTPSDGESFADCYQRAAVFHQHLLLSSNYENNIVVAHGEFNKCYLMYLLNWDVNEFNKCANQKNGEVWLIQDGRLSVHTPLRTSKYF